jgi:hypothetical protein
MRGEMPIKSYLAYPREGQRDALADALGAVPGCQVIPAVNRDLLIVVTDTRDDTAEAAVQEALAGLELLGGLALVAGMAERDPHPVPGSRPDDDPA